MHESNVIDKILFEVKSQGLFDEFRKECLNDVDTKPAYQNLKQRVENTVQSFINLQKWTPDANRNQLREKLRKNITDAGYLETGVERIVDQVVNPKISTVFHPQIEDLVYKYLGIEKPKMVEPVFEVDTKSSLEIKTDLSVDDLDELSPYSDKAGGAGPSNTYDEMDLEDDKDFDGKCEDFESPPFEPIVGDEALDGGFAVKKEEGGSMDSHMSEISGLTSQDSIESESEKPSKIEPAVAEEVASDVKDERPEELHYSVESQQPENNDSQLSQVSSNSRLSIITDGEVSTSPRLDITEEAQMPSFNENSDSFEKEDKGKPTTSNFDLNAEKYEFKGTERKQPLSLKETDFSNLDTSETTKSDLFSAKTDSEEKPLQKPSPVPLPITSSTVSEPTIEEPATRQVEKEDDIVPETTTQSQPSTEEVLKDEIMEALKNEQEPEPVVPEPENEPTPPPPEDQPEVLPPVIEPTTPIPAKEPEEEKKPESAVKTENDRSRSSKSDKSSLAEKSSRSESDKKRERDKDRDRKSDRRSHSDRSRSDHRKSDHKSSPKDRDDRKERDEKSKSNSSREKSSKHHKSSSSSSSNSRDRERSSSSSSKYPHKSSSSSRSSSHRDKDRDHSKSSSAEKNGKKKEEKINDDHSQSHVKPNPSDSNGGGGGDGGGVTLPKPANGSGAGSAENSSSTSTTTTSDSSSNTVTSETKLSLGASQQSKAQPELPEAKNGQIEKDDQAIVGSSDDVFLAPMPPKFEEVPRDPESIVSLSTPPVVIDLEFFSAQNQEIASAAAHDSGSSAIICPITNLPLEDAVKEFKIKKPRYASNFQEARKMQRIRKKLGRHEKIYQDRLIQHYISVNPNSELAHQSQGVELEFACHNVAGLTAGPVISSPTKTQKQQQDPVADSEELQQPELVAEKVVTIDTDAETSVAVVGNNNNDEKKPVVESTKVEAEPMPVLALEKADFLGFPLTDECFAANPAAMEFLLKFSEQTKTIQTPKPPAKRAPARKSTARNKKVVSKIEEDDVVPKGADGQGADEPATRKFKVMIEKIDSSEQIETSTSADTPKPDATTFKIPMKRTRKPNNRFSSANFELDHSDQIEPQNGSVTNEADTCKQEPKLPADLVKKVQENAVEPDKVLLKEPDSAGIQEIVKATIEPTISNKRRHSNNRLQQSYSNEDLYKPRAASTKRRRGGDIPTTDASTVASKT